jgi:hypothetical protein
MARLGLMQGAIAEQNPDVKAGLPQCNCHGLRRIRAAEAGSSEPELMAMFGWMMRAWRESIRAGLRRSGRERRSRSHEKIVRLLSHQKEKIMKTVR